MGSSGGPASGSESDGPGPRRFQWLDALKALAILGILLNHLVEEFAPGPWFTNPSRAWPELSVRLGSIFPQTFDSFWLSLVQFMGWLGDAGPGVFILLSGFGLAWAASSPRRGEPTYSSFLRRRALRLYPLYWVMHGVILGAAVFVPGTEFSLGSQPSLLSVTGIRITDRSFFHIAPAWWFVWTILQLYLVFPLLYRGLKRWGATVFLAATIGITFLSRGAGLLGYTFSDSLYYWMTGLFAGTRLAEFAVGMVLAVALREGKLELPDPGRAAGLTAPVYLIGLVCSFTWPGTVASNLLVTVGLSGLFYAAWEGVLSRWRPLGRGVLWVGLVSYPVYLLHQAPLQWTTDLFGDRPGLHLTAAVAVLALAFPAGRLLQRGTNRLVSSLRGERLDAWRWGASLGAAVALGALLLAEPGAGSPDARLAYELVLGATLAAAGALELRGRDVPRTAPERLLHRAVAVAAGLALWAFPEGFGGAAAGVGIAVSAVVVVVEGMGVTHRRAIITGGALSLLLLWGTETALREHAPMEVGKWGEYPALERHSTREFALIPDTTVRLEYGNYEYTLRTNDRGLPGPDVSSRASRSDEFRILAIGDAFTMPEALPQRRSYVARLERQLNGCVADRRVEVINAGVTGYGPRQQSPQLRELMPELSPDLVIYQFFINEFGNVARSREQLYRSIGFTEPPSIRERTFGDLQLLARLQRFRVRLEELVTGEPAEWRDREALLHYYRRGTSHLYTSEIRSKMAEYLSKMREVTLGADVPFVIFHVPGAVAVTEPEDLDYFPHGVQLSDTTRWDLSRPYRHLRQITDSLGIPTSDMTGPLARRAKDSSENLYFPESWHWTEAGHRVAADVIAAELAERGLVPGACGESSNTEGP